MKIVFLDAVSVGDTGLDPLRQCGELTCYPTSPREAVVERLRGSQVAITNKVPIARIDLERLPDLQLICVAATGYDVVDVVAARERGVLVANVVDYSTASVAQLTWALILQLTTPTQALNQRVRAGDWVRSPVFALLEPSFRDLAGQTLGLIGYGAIGRQVGAIAQAFGLQIIPYRSQSSRADLESLLQQSDIVSLHCPLTPATHHLISNAELALMKSSALLINTARGALIDPEALYTALSQQRIRAAGLDVWAPEPPPAEWQKLFNLENTLVTPHVGWASLEARNRLIQGIAANIAAFQAGELCPVWQR